MTAFATCLFAVAAFVSTWAILTALRRHGPDALTLRTQLGACPGTLVVTWKVVERVPVPALAVFRKRPARRAPARLEWPGSSLELAA